MGLKYFWDSYAIIELMNANPGYAPLNAEPVVLTEYNLMEVYWSELREHGTQQADRTYAWLKPFVAAIDDDTIKEAMRLRLKHKKERLSYADCIGYIYAKRNKLKFLTGDTVFEGLPNVEFVR